MSIARADALSLKVLWDLNAYRWLRMLSIKDLKDLSFLSREDTIDMQVLRT